MGAALRIFLSYRREDSAHQTGRIADRLKREFGDDSLFMDVDGIPLGVDFHKRLNDEVARCDVLIAAIGNRWIDLTDETGPALQIARLAQGSLICLPFVAALRQANRRR